ncbi:hypothetical protein RND71_013285 [Anisodus tanguticus]|uniref:Alkaline/neutral invertase n=1 Tax=Anisodus tanguticus TaxID=243964 RepID=A0AAE1SEP6_9SOLA|nr:hypothetical protein RND71_013285 [Anisodus tanguticus]
MHTVSPRIPNHTPDEQNKQQENGAKPFSEGFKTAAAVNSRPKTNTDSIEDEAWHFLRAAMVYYCGGPVGTIAANDLREYDIVRNFILHTLQLQSWEKTMDWYSPGQGLMPASFKVCTVPLDNDESATEDVLDPDFGEAAIGRVAPVDSGLWWIILLRAYGKCSGDVQTGIKMVLRLCLADGFDMFPTLLALYCSALLCAREMLAPEEASTDLVRALNSRLLALLMEWMPSEGGYLIGNLQPAHMDFQFFSLGNLWSMVSSLANIDQSHAILDLIEAKWEDLVADMPLKICYPALEARNEDMPWSYHNGGSWPTLLWQSDHYEFHPQMYGSDVHKLNILHCVGRKF